MCFYRINDVSPTGLYNVNTLPAGAPESKQHQQPDYNNSTNKNCSLFTLFEAPQAH